MSRIIIAAAFIAATYAVASDPATAQQPVDYCQYATRTIIMLVDRTSPFDETDRKTLEASLPAIDRYLDGRTLFSLQTIEAGVTEGQTLLEGCIPDCPASSMKDVFIGSSCIPARANADRAKFKRDFYTKLRELAESPVETKQSDVIGRIVELARTFNTPNRPLTHLVVFSDLIDNVVVPHRTIYTQSPDQTMRVVRQKRMLASLKGTYVAVFGFGRSDIPPRGSLPPDQSARLRTFWMQWFEASGAANTSLGFRLQPPDGPNPNGSDGQR